MGLMTWGAGTGPAWGQTASRKSAGQTPATKRAPAAAPAVKPDPAVEKQKEAKMERLLQLWEQRSTRLKSLDVKIKRTDTNPKWKEVEEFLGRAILKSPDLAWLNWDKYVVKNEKKVPQPCEQIRCTGTEVWQYLCETSQIHIFPLDQEKQQRALDEGPLPFLFNMRVAEVKQRYLMRYLREDQRSYIIEVTPLKHIDRQSFSKAFLQLDRQYLLPTRIFLFSPDGASTRDLVLTDIKPNAAVAEDNFKGQPWKGWQVVRHEANEGRIEPGQPVPRSQSRGNAAPAARTSAMPNPKARSTGTR
jgi:TIGR03009 family protein